MAHWSNTVESLARDLVAELMIDTTELHLPWANLLIGAPLRDCRRWLETIKSWRPQHAEFVEAAISFVKDGEKAVERRNDLIHRGFTFATVITGDAATSWQGHALGRSRRGNQTELLGGQLEDAADSLMAIAKTGGTLLLRITEARPRILLPPVGPGADQAPQP